MTRRVFLVKVMFVLVLLRKYNYLEPRNFELQLIKPPKDQIVWWSKNPVFKYLDPIKNIPIYPNLGEIDNNPNTMYGTSVYLFFKENELIRSTFQIIQNKMMANLLLNRLNEEIVEVVGNPSSKSDNLIIWEGQNEQFSIEFPKRMHGYIHLMKSNVKL